MNQPDQQRESDESPDGPIDSLREIARSWEALYPSWQWILIDLVGALLFFGWAIDMYRTSQPVIALGIGLLGGYLVWIAVRRLRAESGGGR
jgi:F0F1-type ATP synthase assembly protein I